MTVICGGGASTAKPGYGETVAFTASAIAALLNNIPTPWAVPLAGYIGLVTFNLSTFCTDDPPAVPTITAADIAALFNAFNPIAFNDAQSKFQQLVGAYAWFLMCQCSSGATPAPPTAPTTPAGAPTVNPSQPPVTTTGGCYDVSATFVESECTSVAASGGHHAYNWTEKVMTNVGRDTTVVSGQPQFHQYRIPAGATHWAYSITTIAGGPGTQQNFDCTVGLTNDAGTATLTGGSVPIPPNGQTYQTSVGALPSGSTQVIFTSFDSNHSSGIQVTFRLQFFCNGQTGPSIQQPCCPPDTVTSGLLDNILQLVTLIQRQQVPFSYIQSTAHSGLTGMGHFSVQGLIGALVHFTGGIEVGVESGDPDVYFNAGWITWGNADGSSSRVWLDSNPQLSLPASAGQYTRIGYSLRPGVTATITELTREP